MDLLDHDHIVINQKAKVIELTAEYAIRDVEGGDVGMIRQEGQSKMKKLARFVSSLDQFMTHALSVYQADGAKVLEITRPRKIMKSTVQVADGTGAPLGTIRQQNMIGKINFGLHDVAEQKIGEIRAENWRAWNFSIVGRSGTGGGPHHQDVGGPRQDDVHHRRQLRPRRQAGMPGPAALAGVRLGGVGGLGAQAGCAGAQLDLDRVVVIDVPNHAAREVRSSLPSRTSCRRT